MVKEITRDIKQPGRLIPKGDHQGIFISLHV